MNSFVVCTLLAVSTCSALTVKRTPMVRNTESGDNEIQRGSMTKPAVSLLKALYDEHKDIVISSQSVFQGANLIYAGASQSSAGSNAKNELYEFLDKSYDNGNSVPPTQGDDYVSQIRLFEQYGFKMSEKYRESIRSYEYDNQTVDFRSSEGAKAALYDINLFGEMVTREKVQKTLNETANLSRNSQFNPVQGFYSKGTWKIPYSGAKSDSSSERMLYYYSNDREFAVGFPTYQQRFRMYFVCPSYSLKQYVSSLTQEKLKSIGKDAKLFPINAHLPEFNAYSQSISLKNAFRKANVNEIFSATNSPIDIIGDERLHMNEIYQSAYVHFGESGYEFGSTTSWNYASKDESVQSSSQYRSGGYEDASYTHGTEYQCGSASSMMQKTSEPRTLKGSFLYLLYDTVEEQAVFVGTVNDLK